MLVLTRNRGERVIVRDRETGAELTLEVVRIGPAGVRLGLTAPSRYEILRGELEERWGIVDEPQAALAPTE